MSKKVTPQLSEEDNTIGIQLLNGIVYAEYPIVFKNSL